MMYPFSLGDLRDSSIVLANIWIMPVLQKFWEDLRYLFGEITYGGQDITIRQAFEYYLFGLYLQDNVLDQKEMFHLLKMKGGIL